MSWRLRDVLYSVLLYLVVMAVFFVSASMFFGQTVFEESPHPYFFLVEELVDSVVLAGAAMYFLRIRYKESYRSIGLHAESIRKNVGLGVLTGLVLWLLVLLLDLAFQAMFLKSDVQHPLIARIQRTQSLLDYFSIVLSAGLIAPVAEEIFFRGFIYTLLKRHFRTVTAVVATSVAFVLLHLHIEWFVEMMLIGLTLTLIFEYAGSLVATIAAHSAMNVLSLALALVNKAQG